MKLFQTPEKEKKGLVRNVLHVFLERQDLKYSILNKCEMFHNVWCLLVWLETETNTGVFFTC